MSANIPVKKQELQAARSDLLDAFVEIETALRQVETELNLKPSNASLGQRIGRIQKASPDADLAKVLAQIAALNEVRTEVVHRSMSVVAIHGTAKALFIDQSERDHVAPTARLISIDQFTRMSEKLHKLRESLFKGPRKQC